MLSLVFSLCLVISLLSNMLQLSSLKWCNKNNYQLSSTWSNFLLFLFSDSSFLDVCSNDIRHGKTVNLIYRGNTQNKTKSSQTELCNCLVSTSNCKSLSRLRFRTADIRLQQQDNMRSCHIHSKFFITDTMGHRNFSCKTNHMYRGYSDLYYSQPNNPYARISLYNRPGQFPSFFWLEISGRYI